MSITPTQYPEITFDGLTIDQVSEYTHYVDFNTLLLTVQKNPQEIHLGLIIHIADRNYEVEHLAYEVDAVGTISKLIVGFKTREDDPQLKLEEA